MKKRLLFDDGSRLSRRQLITNAAGIALGAVGGRIIYQQALAGKLSAHDDWFLQLSRALSEAKVARPVLVIDAERAKHNLKQVMQSMTPKYNYRIVAKSLPSLPLIEWVMKESGTQRLMLFNEPFLRIVSQAFPTSDILMGKPLPVAAAQSFYENFDPKTGFSPEQQLQWLVDNQQRLKQYTRLAENLQRPLGISLEINLGLHRGGLDTLQELDEALHVIKSHPLLKFRGFMGYEAHIVKAPGSWQRHFRIAMERYASFVDRSRELFPESEQPWTLNAGGSTTYSLYQDQKNLVPNELAVGSAILQPTDFDLPSLRSHRPAVFIATPVLKRRDGLHLPGAPGLGRALGLWDRHVQQSFFIDGGYWKAQLTSPPNLQVNQLYGRSSNQELLTGSRGVQLEVDDWVFLRPSQSESVLLEFGDLLVYDSKQGRIAETWKPFVRPTTTTGRLNSERT